MNVQQVRGWGLALVAGLLASGVIGSTPATAQTVDRPLDDFLDAQGTFDFFGIQFVPPVPNFIGATDLAADLGLSVDYAGLADAACDGIAGTTFQGAVTETELPDGRALVSVDLKTSNAITWVIDGEDGTFDFGGGPVLFGTRWSDVDGECVFDEFPTLGESHLQTTFVIPEPGDPLPDLLALAIVASGLGEFFPDQIPEGLELITLDLEAKAKGELADGTPAEVETVQKSEVIDGVWIFTEELIELTAE